MGNCCAAPKTEFQGSRRRRCPGSGDMEKFDSGIVSHSTESGAMEKFDPITEDAFMEILLRLPVRAILRCRVLSKFHRALIDSPDFIRKHCHQSMKPTTTYRTYFMIRDNYETITWMPDKRRPGDRYHSMDFMEDDSNNYVAELDRIRFINHPLGYLHNYDHEFYIVGCCMGIVAFLYTTRARQPEPGIFFYNPSTRKYRTITLNLNDDYKDGADQRYFLGYDTVTEDMKLLQILNKRGTSSVAEQLYVYGSRMDSWKKIQGFNNQWPNLYLLGISEVFVEGTNCLHMPAFDSDHYTIVTFNFSTESFSLAPLPPDPGFTTRKVGEAPFWPASLSGCFCLYSGEKRSPFAVWVMKEYGVEESWTKIFSLDFHCYMKPLDLMNNQRQLLLWSASPDEGIYVYDTDKKTTKDVTCKFGFKFHHEPDHLLFTRSLMLP